MQRPPGSEILLAVAGWFESNGAPMSGFSEMPSAAARTGLDIALVRRGFSRSGGAESYLLRLAARLTAQGHRLTLYCAGWPREQWPHGPLVELGGSSPLAFARMFAARRKPEHDVVFSMERTPDCDVFRAGDGVHAAWLERRAGFESGWRRRVRRWNPKHRQLLTLERGLFAPGGARFVIANSQLVAREITRHYRLPAERLRVIYNGVEPAAATAGERVCARSQLGLPQHTFLVLFAGSGWERKNIRTAIRAVAGVPGALLVVAGKGPADRFRAPHVVHLGEVRCMDPVFAACDLFLHPTWYDPFSNACLEALAGGLPVITSGANGAAEILTAETGSVIDAPDDAAALAEALRGWRDRGSRVPLDSCRRLAAAYSIERNVRETLALFRQVAEARKSGSAA